MITLYCETQCWCCPDSVPRLCFSQNALGCSHLSNNEIYIYFIFFIVLAARKKKLNPAPGFEMSTLSHVPDLVLYRFDHESSLSQAFAVK